MPKPHGFDPRALDAASEVSKPQNFGQVQGHIAHPSQLAKNRHCVHRRTRKFNSVQLTGKLELVVSPSD